MMLHRKTRSISTVAATVALSLALGGVAAAASNGAGSMGGGGSSGGGAVQQRAGAQQGIATQIAAQAQTRTTIAAQAQTRTTIQAATQTKAATQTQAATQTRVAAQTAAQTWTTTQQRAAVGEVDGLGVCLDDPQITRLRQVIQDRLRDDLADGSGRICPVGTAAGAQTSAMMWRLQESTL